MFPTGVPQMVSHKYDTIYRPRLSLKTGNATFKRTQFNEVLQTTGYTESCISHCHFDHAQFNLSECLGVEGQ
jgi:hypothetical protein